MDNCGQNKTFMIILKPQHIILHIIAPSKFACDGIGLFLSFRVYYSTLNNRVKYLNELFNTFVIITNEKGVHFVFYNNYLKICEERGIAPTRVLVDLGISKSAISNWKNGGEPSNRTKKAIADYFGITVRQLMDGEIENAPTPVKSEDDELEDILEEARRNPDLRILFSLSRKATPEELRKYIKMIKLMCGDEDGSDNC